MESYIDWSQPTLYISIGSIIFNPLFWNIVARAQYRNNFISNMFGGNKLYGCYALAATIFTLGLIRDYLFDVALQYQPTQEFLQPFIFKVVSGILFVCGNTLVLTSMYKLGITGTYLGDYFGILMKERVISFPFNTMNNPMYNGSTMVFLSLAIWRERVAGVFLALVVFVVYRTAITLEGPFTAHIYENRDKEAKEGKKRSKKE